MAAAYAMTMNADAAGPICAKTGKIAQIGAILQSFTLPIISYFDVRSLFLRFLCHRGTCV